MNIIRAQIMTPEQFVELLLTRVYTKDQLLSMVKQAKREWEERAYPDTEADGYVFCGKCGKMS